MLTLVLLLIAQTASPGALVGRWDAATQSGGGLGQWFEFAADGTFTRTMGAMVDTTWRFTCDRTPWIAGPRANTGVIDLSLMWSYGEFGPSIGFVCPESSGDKFVSLGYPALPDAPTTGSLTLTVHGILDDATAWAATRTTQLE
jgi:hypothetical protein